MIEQVTIPARTRARKHVFSEADAEAAVSVLEAGGNPGRGGYSSSGVARGAATALAEMCGGDDIGTSTWQAEDGTWWFALRIGKKKANGTKAKTKK